MNAMKGSGTAETCVRFALSIRQPWTELILQGRKTIEVRSWATAYRGELWLHAGVQPDADALARFGFTLNGLSRGAIVGKCELHDCIAFTDETWEAWRPRHLSEGSLNKRQYAWLLGKPMRIPPMPFKGRLGLMRMDAMERK